MSKEIFAMLFFLTRNSSAIDEFSSLVPLAHSSASNKKNNDASQRSEEDRFTRCIPAIGLGTTLSTEL